MRARNIKPGFFHNEDLVECEPLTRLLFVGLWCYADREGRFEWRPKKIKLEVLPEDDCNIDKLLNELLEKDLISKYSLNGKDYAYIPTFLKHQKPHVREAVSNLPAPTKAEPRTDLGNGEAQPRRPDSLNPDIPIKDMQVSPALLFPLKDGTDYPLELAKISEYEKTYGSKIDVQFELKECLQWDIDNPDDRKTEKGILRHINFWLNRAVKDKSLGLQPGIEPDNTALEEAREDREQHDPIKAREKIRELALMVGKNV